jgi:hypothetical protein
MTEQTFNDWKLLYGWYYGDDSKLPEYENRSHYHNNFKGNIEMIIRCKGKLEADNVLTLENSYKLTDHIMNLEHAKAYNLIVKIVKEL